MNSIQLHFFILTVLTCLATGPLPTSPAAAQSQTRSQTKSVDANSERIRIDDKTARIVKSPWQMMEADTTASLRGLSLFSARNIWGGGTGGTVVNSFNGGETWRVLTIPGAEELDIRDAHAFDEATVVAMTAGTPARIYRTTNAGLSWKMVYENDDERVFFDAISFLDDRNGIVMSDPVDAELFLLKTIDGGLTWQRMTKTPRTFPGEGGFAASGTNMTTIGFRKVIIGLGSGVADQPPKRSRVVISEDLMKTWKSADVPLPRHQSAGIFSIVFANANDGVAVGGDYKEPESTAGNYAITRDGGATWTVPRKRKPPTGFRSCVSVWMNGKEVNFVAVGTNGTDLSTDLGESWTRISNTGFHAIQFTSDGQFGWAVGSDGRIAKWVGPK